MTAPYAIARTSQSLNPGTLVEMFTIDTSPLGLNDTFNFAPKGPFRFGGIPFVKVDCEAEGFEWSGDGPLPQPKLRITNATNLLVSACLKYNDLIGAKFMRYRTYTKYLDGAPEADSAAQYEPDVYTFEQKTGQEETSIEWSLASAMDQDGRMLPGRTVRRDSCGWRYRRFNATTGALETMKATCPYRGAAYFDVFGVATTIDKDKCGKRQSDCKLRYGANGVLPYGGFPGIARVRG